MSLDADVFRPLHKTGQVSLRSDVSSDTEVLLPAHEEWALVLANLLSSGLSGCNNLLSLW